MPAIAASTCSQAPASWQIVAISAVGSKAIDEVVPRVAHTKNGVSPAARSDSISVASESGRIANSASCSTTRIDLLPTPAIRSAFSTLEWACAVA